MRIRIGIMLGLLVTNPSHGHRFEYVPPMSAQECKSLLREMNVKFVIGERPSIEEAMPIFEPLLYYYAKRVRKKYGVKISREDLMTVGKIELLRIWDSYDPKTGHTFFTYVRGNIYGVMAAKAIRALPFYPGVYHDMKRILSVQENLRSEGVEPTPELIGAELNLKPARVKYILEKVNDKSAQRPKSLFSRRDGETLEIAAPEPKPDRWNRDPEFDQTLEKAMNEIGKTDRQAETIFRRRYQLGMTLDQIADTPPALGISRETVRKVLMDEFHSQTIRKIMRDFYEE